MYMKQRLFILLMLVSLFSCKKNNDEIINDEVKQKSFIPSDFKLEVENLEYFSAKIVWEASKIEDNSRIAYDVFLDDVLKIENTETLFYTFSELKEASEHKLKIVAKSEYDTNKISLLSFTTKTCPKPKSVTLKAEHITADGFTISWPSSDEGDKYSVFLNDIEQIADISQASYKFTKLKALTKYKVKVVTKNIYDKTTEQKLEVSTVDHGAPEEFKIGIHTVEPTKASVSWSKPDDTAGFVYKLFLNDKLIQYDIRNSFYNFTDLSEDTDYTVKIIVTNAFGKSREQESSFKTKLKERPADFNIEVTNITKGSASVTIKKLTENSDVVVYKLFVNGFYRFDVYNKKSKIINDLEANTEYTIKVEATNYKQNKLTKEIKFRTSANYTLSDFETKANTVKACSAIITWEDCRASDGRAVTYSVHRKETEGNVEWYKLKSGLGEKQFILQNLKPNTSYEYKVTARTSDYFTYKESIVSFTTTKTAEPSDFDVSISQITDQSACVSCTVSSVNAVEEYNKFVTYELTLNGKTRTSSNNFNNIKIDGLSADVEYEAIVKVTSYYGEVKISKKTFRTLPAKVYNISLNSVGSTPRSISLEWGFDNNPEVQTYHIYVNGVRDGLATGGLATSYTFNRLISNTEYVFKLEAKNNAGGLVGEKTIKASTAAYPNIGDFDVIINKDIYSKVSIDISDVENKYGNNLKIDGYTTKYYINGNIQYPNREFINNKVIKDLTSSTVYVLKLEIYNPDGTKAYEVSKNFTTAVNAAPLWEVQPLLVKVNVNQIDISNAYAVDRESGVTYKYFFNDKEWTGGVTENDIINEQVDDGANQDGKLIKLSHLKYNTHYSFYIVAVDAEGKETKSSVVNFTTSSN